MILAISPIDGRYTEKTKELIPYFSEFALIKYRLKIEIEYFINLIDIASLPQLQHFPKQKYQDLRKIYENFSVNDAEKIKAIEKVTNHDVKAVEYFIKENFDHLDLSEFKEFIHFGLTSQDINNTAIPLSLQDALNDVLIPIAQSICTKISNLAIEYKGIPMLARTHGQAASPTTLGKEFAVFEERLNNELEILKSIKLKCKFGGATGNLNAHKVTYPSIDWISFSNEFCESLGLVRHQYTTQIAHYDDLASVFHSWMRFNTILLDFSRDIWTYISMDYFKQKVVANEVGSSAMPHKVNPIDFENAEGNFGIANAIFGHLADKLPVSRLQRDLTDSTVLRNIGVPFGHVLISFNSLKRGLGKLLVNKEKMTQDLNNNWAVVAEGIQNILRRESIEKPYEMLKDLTRGKSEINEEDIRIFIQNLPVNEDIKNELWAITPFNYIGYY